MIRIGHSLKKATDQSSKCAIGKISNKKHIIAYAIGYVKFEVKIEGTKRRKGNMIE